MRLSLNASRRPRARSSQGDLRASVTSVLAAAATAALFELVVHLADVREPSPGYLALCFSLSVGAAAVAGVGAGALKLGPSGSLALWAGLHGGFLVSWPVGLASTASTYAAIRLVKHSTVSPGQSGAAVAAALGAAFVAWPRLADDLLAGLGNRPEAAVLIQTGVLVAVLAVAHARRGGAGAPLTPALAAALLGAMALGAWASAWDHPDRRLPRFDPPRVEAALPHILLLVLDTVAADHLSIYGYERDTTPQLARFVTGSDRAVVYPLAHAPATWTVPSHASLVTGRLASEHGVHEDSLLEKQEILRRPLPAEPTLAERLREHGYRTAAILANPTLLSMTGLERGFDWFVLPMASVRLPLLGEALRDRLLPYAYLKRTFRLPDARTINDRVLRFLDRCSPAPCFVLANYMEAHAPYLPAGPEAGLFSDGARVDEVGPARTEHSDETLRSLEDRYDEEIRVLDRHLGDLLDALERQGILDSAWLIITSDHGEAFGEHGVTEHGTTVFGEVTHVPLVIQPPAGEQLPKPSGAVSLIDVAATIAAVASGETLGAGRDLRREAPPWNVQIEFFGRPAKADEHGALAAHPARAVVRGAFKLIQHDDGRALYQLDEDPQETRNRINESPEIAESLRGALPPLRRPDAGGRQPARLSREQRRALQALGYLP